MEQLDGHYKRAVRSVYRALFSVIYIYISFPFDFERRIWNQTPRLSTFFMLNSAKHEI